MSVCAECGLQENAWPHSVYHPAVKTRPEAHLFVDAEKTLGIPTKPKRGPAKHRQFSVGDIAIWRYPHAPDGQPALRVKVVGSWITDAGTLCYLVANNEDVWDVNQYSCPAKDLTLVTWGGSL